MKRKTTDSATLAPEHESCKKPLARTARLEKNADDVARLKQAEDEKRKKLDIFATTYNLFRKFD